MPQLILPRRTLAALVFLGVAPAMGTVEGLDEIAAVRAAYPRPIALAASWDPALVREVNAAVARQARERGTRLVLGPTLDVARDPRRGRIEETFGEDAHLVGELGVAAVEGLQGKGPRLAPGTVLAAVGHLAGPALPGDAAGPAPVAPREMREVYLAPFEQVAKRAAPAAIVVSRNEIDGIPAHANRWLLRDVVRGEWRYGGALLAAPGAIEELHSVYRVAANARAAEALAAEAGVDLGGIALEPRAQAAPRGPNAPAYGVARSRALALKAAQRSIVLLKNEGALPFTRSASGVKPRVAIVSAGAPAAILETLRGRARARAEVVANADTAQHVVLALGDAPAAEQRAALEALAAGGKPVVVVLCGDRPDVDPAIARQASALLAAWGLGERGGDAVADVLFGDVNPGGKLPLTIARQPGQLPLFYDAKPSARRGYLFDSSDPLFAFGWGLGYAPFELGPPRLSAPSMAIDGSVRISVEVRNRGRVAGDETVQVYVRDRVSSVTRPVKQLKAFQRVRLAAGGRRTVTFTLDAASLAMWDDNMRRVVEPGDFEILAGPDSAHLQSAALTVVGATR